MTKIARIAIAIVMCSLAGCGGGSGASRGTASAVPPVAPAKGSATFTITVPSGALSSSQSTTRKPLYIPANATQLLIGLTQSGTAVSGFPETVGLTPASPGCSVVGGSTVCTIALNVPTGSYVASLTLEDAAGHALSIAQSIALPVVAGVVNNVPVILSGIPVSIAVSSTSPFVTGTQAAGFTVIGAGGHAFVVNVLDTDGNIIIGAGAPTFAAAQSGSLALTITPPPVVTSNVLTIAPPAAFGTGTTSVTLNATYPGATNACTAAGAQCSVAFNVGMQELIAIAYSTPNEISLVEDGTTAVIAQITTAQDATLDGPDAIAFDAAGDLFVSNYGFLESQGNVAEFAPPYTGAPINTYTSGFSQFKYAQSLALDAAGDVYVGIYNQEVIEYPAGSTTPSRTLNYAVSGVSDPVSLCTDPSGDLFIANNGGNGSVQEFAPGNGTTEIAGITSLNSPLGIACDALGNVVFRQYAGGQIEAATLAGPLFTNLRALSPAGPQALAVDPHNNFYIANNGTGPTNDIEKYPSGSASSSVVVNNAGIVIKLAIDASGNVIAADDSGGLYEFPSGSMTHGADILNQNGPEFTSDLAISP